MRSFVLACLILGGCGVDSDIEDRVTISSGIYGQVLSLDDVGPPFDHSYVANLPIAIYGENPSMGMVMPDASTRTDDRGFFQLERAPSRFFLCAEVGFKHICATGTTGAGRWRLDFDTGASLVWRCHDASRCPADLDQLDFQR